jgi:hypothetical protein
MSEDNGSQSRADDKTGPDGTIPNTRNGVGVGAGGADSTFEPEETPEAAPDTAGAGTEAPDQAAGPAAEKDRQTPDDRGLTTDTTPSD